MNRTILALLIFFLHGTLRCQDASRNSSGLSEKLASIEQAIDAARVAENVPSSAMTSRLSAAYTAWWRIRADA